MHIFHTFFAIFSRKKIFLENPAPSVFRSSKKLLWYQKSENSNEPFEWNLPDWRTDWLTNEGKSIGPYLIGRSKKHICKPYIVAFKLLDYTVQTMCEKGVKCKSLIVILSPDGFSTRSTESMGETNSIWLFSTLNLN